MPNATPWSTEHQYPRSLHPIYLWRMPSFIACLLALLCTASSATFAKALIVGVAPSLPKPVAEAEELQQQIIKKKSKFAAKQRKLEQHR